MPESRSLREKKSRFPKVVPAAKVPSTAVSKKTGILGALAVFAPLAVEVIYGLTRKWLAEIIISKPVRNHGQKGDCEKTG
jgi:LPS O-antigen subunit length determinant protein (WzzB/FepE family)